MRIRKRTPYLCELLEAVTTAGVEEVVFIAGTQIAKTTWQEAALSEWSANDPGPALLVKPTQASCEQYVKERLREIFRASPALAKLMSPSAGDNTLDCISLVNGMRISMGWAGSPQALASRPCRRVILDEVDKFPPFSGREADPVSLARERTRTFKHRKCVILCSTPTTRDGAIWKAFEACGVRLFYWVPCPHCGLMQRLAWAQVKYPKADEGEDKIAHAERVEQKRLAYYECPECHGRIVDDHKPKMLEAGKWLTEAGQPRPKTKRIGFHMSSLYSPWRDFSDMAAEWIKADGDVAATMNFRNSGLAEPFEVLTAKPKASIIRDKAAVGHPPRIVPDWAQVLLATADSQKDHYRYVVRAWGYGNRSRLIDYGMAASGDDLKRRTIDAVFTRQDGRPEGCPLLIVDSGGGKKNSDSEGEITARVYTLARQDPTRIRAAKGASSAQNQIVRESFLKDSQILLWLIDTDRAKDQLFSMINAPDATQWEVHREAGSDYANEMASEHKVFDRAAKRELWCPVTGGAANHYWDCEVEQVAAAFKLGLGMVPPPPQQPAAPQQSQQSNPLSYRGRW